MNPRNTDQHDLIDVGLAALVEISNALRASKNGYLPDCRGSLPDKDGKVLGEWRYTPGVRGILTGEDLELIA